MSVRGAILVMLWQMFFLGLGLGVLVFFFFGGGGVFGVPGLGLPLGSMLRVKGYISISWTPKPETLTPP